MIRFRNLICTATKLKLYNAFTLLETVKNKLASYYIIQEDNQRTQNMLITLYECLNYESFPKYLKDMLTLRQFVCPSRRTNFLSPCKPATTTYGLNSFRYLALHLSNGTPPTV